MPSTPRRWPVPSAQPPKQVGTGFSAAQVVPALVVAALTTIPARLGARRPTAEILQAELA
jgi:hypothetical protein